MILFFFVGRPLTACPAVYIDRKSS